MNEPGDPINVADYERLAAERMEPGPHAYYAGGAADERTLRANVEAFSQYRLRPRVLVDVSTVTTETSVLGTDVSMPILVAPVAFQRLAHPDGEVAMARAAAAAGTIMTLSTIATSRPREIAAECPRAPRWFQLYCFRDRAITRALIDEAVECGFDAIALTVDAPRAGRRERDFRQRFVVPEGIHAPAVAAATGSERALTVAEVFNLVDASLEWDDFAELASQCDLPMIVKGIQTAEDATLAVEHGAAAVIVSNHGGRQLDGVAPTLEILPEVVDAVGEETEVLMDGGIRRGTDVLTALALGARAVLVGRPALWGLAVDGEQGVRHVLELLRAEVELGLILLGCSSPLAVSSAHVRRRSGG